MRTHILLATAAVCASFVAAPAQAAEFVVEGTVPANEVSYIQFVFGGGSLSIATTGILGPSGQALSDPMIRLFVDDGFLIGGLTGSLVATDDDGGLGLDSLISSSFGAGSYILAVGAFPLGELEARTGIASFPSSDSDFRTTFTTNSAFQLSQTAPVPEPATWAMMLIGFGAVGGAMRSRRKQRLTVSYA